MQILCVLFFNHLSIFMPKKFGYYHFVYYICTTIITNKNTSLCLQQLYSQL